jgi:hypothetical protein
MKFGDRRAVRRLIAKSNRTSRSDSFQGDQTVKPFRSFAKPACALLSALVLASGCDFPQEPRAVTISNPPAIRPSKPLDIKTLHEAMATIMTICREDLLLPAADPIELRLYKNIASFASYGQGWKSLPIDLDNVTAFTRNDTIHINLATTGEQWEELIGLLAHEYGHAIAAAISNRSTSRWFSEGFANWVAARVLHSLGWRDYALTLERSQIELINNHDGLKRLNDLNWHWKALSDKPKGHIETYVLAFFATARLIDRQGLPATMEYIKSGNFKKSFHMSQAEFASDTAVHLSSLIPSKKTHPAVMPKPHWEIGDQWTYAVKDAGDDPLTTAIIIREDRFEGETSYVIKTGGSEVFQSKQTLEQVASFKAGQLTRKTVGSSHDFSWPLTLGKQWRNNYSREDLATKSKHNIDFSMVVSEISNITVSAGTFLAARVQGYDSLGGRLMWEYWYSPTTKSIVKLRDYSDVVFRVEELTSFKIK